MKLGFDLGSKNISYALIHEDEIIEHKIMAHNGDLKGSFYQLVNEIYEHFGKDHITNLGISGSIDLKQLKIIDPILASVEANRFLKTGCHNILSIGCESFYLILLDENLNYVEHSVNSDCASGTGSFIDQQAERLGFTTETLANRAAQFSGHTPSIATRCAVFAKSDIIHAQAQGFSKDAIAAGICEGVARTVLSNVIKGRKLAGKTLMIGGVSQNKKIIRELNHMISSEITVIADSAYLNAIGAALLGCRENINPDQFIEGFNTQRELRDKLAIKLTQYPSFEGIKNEVEQGIEVTIYQALNQAQVNLYLGIDIGSTSTKAVITDENKTILAGLYGRTQGDPVDAVSRLFQQIKRIYRHLDFTIKGVATTGSGRALIKEIINADLAVNEITAHARGAAFIDPDVDTIIEIGGQDSKFTQLQNGEVLNAAMNYVCAAGTGSFIEEQAKRLGITLDEISGMALGQEAPYTSDRCTVYMERDLNIFQKEGWKKEQIITSVLFSVRDNYLSKVVGKSKIGEKIYFQGATARNKALVAVFENELNKPILVSKYCHLTGALGAVLYLMDKCGQDSKWLSQFKSIDLSYQIDSEVCRLCSNQCDLRVYTVNGQKTAWGLKCGRDYAAKQVGQVKKISRLEKQYHSIFDNALYQKTGARTIGIPVTLYMVEYYPLFQSFFQKLGFNVVLEQGHSRKIKDGMELVQADFCTPMILTHGLIQSLMKKEVDYIFMPAIINEQSYLNRLEEEENLIDKESDSFFCYYSEYAATIVNHLASLDLKNKLISPKIKWNNRSLEKVAAEIAADLTVVLDQPLSRIQQQFMAAYHEFEQAGLKWIEQGRQIIQQDPEQLKILILGRPYAVFDSTVNLNIPEKLESYGFQLLYQSMLEFQAQHSEQQISLLDKMHWFYGQQIMLATEKLLTEKNIYPVFLTCFRCSPDAYLINYFKESMKKMNKPYLIIQLDEHTSDVGYQTRIEAAIETFYNDSKNQTPINRHPVQLPYNNAPIQKDDTLLIPYISPIISELQKIAFQAHGYKAMVMPLEQKMINLGYRYATGGECMPNVSIIGSVIETIKREQLESEKTILYLPTACLGCNFNQFALLIDLACKNAGIRGLKIANSKAAKQIPELSKKLNTDLLSVNILSSILYKLYYRYRTYEIESGKTEQALESSIALIQTCLKEEKSLLEAAKEIRQVFEKVEILNYRRPKIAILGDIYAKYNSVLNEDIYSLIEELGGEVIVPSFTETVAHLIDSDVRENGLDKKFLKGLILYEKAFERVFRGMLDDQFEPSLDECIQLMYDFGIQHFIPGETTMNISRTLYYIKHKLVSAVINVNPMLCCPGVISASISRKIQKEYQIPIIDLFYDGSNQPNKTIIPHLYYLVKENQERVPV